jgi:alanine racemase
VPRRPAWIEVDLDAIAHNYRLVRGRIGPDRRVLAVVKANAYGHGAVPVARRLVTEGADMLGVATAEEGHELREAGIIAPVLVMGAAGAAQIPGMLAAGLTATAYSAASLDAILGAGDAGHPVPFHLKLDTGMGRLGLVAGELPEALARLSGRRGRASMTGIFTTLSSSDDPDDPFTASQLRLFASALQAVRDAGFSPGFVHVANSGGIIDHPPSWLDTVRPGIMLYGVHPSGRSSRMDLRPALTVKSRLVLVKEVPAGTPIGYGRAFVTRRPGRIGTIPIGYADGIPRLFAEEGHALVRGRAAPYAGRISMDHCMLDVTDLPQAAEGDEVVLLGRQCAAEITADLAAGWARTISYEILARLGSRLSRLPRSGAEPENSL